MGDKTFNCKKGDIKIAIYFYGVIFDMEKCIENLLGNEDVIFENHVLNVFLQYNNEGVLKGRFFVSVNLCDFLLMRCFKKCFFTIPSTL